MAEAGIRDRFANIAAISTLQSGTNVLTFAPLATNMGFLGRRDQALAMVIDEIQYRPNRSMMSRMTTSDDFITMALVISNLVTDLEDHTDRRILDFTRLQRLDLGVAASATILETPLRHQFFPPLITAERTLHLGVMSGGLDAADTCMCRILYRVETLTGAELVELSEVFRLTG